MTDSAVSLPFKTEEDWEKARQEACALAKDETIAHCLLVMSTGRLLTALAKMVLQRSLQEEGASESMYEYFVAVADDKAKNDGRDIDMDNLLESLQTYIPKFVREERSRVLSEDQTAALRKAAANRNVVCNVTVLGNQIELPPGHLLLLLGSSTAVSKQLEDVLFVDAYYSFLDGTPVSRDEMLYMHHTYLSNPASELHTLELEQWSGKGMDFNKWRKMLFSLPQRRFFTAISNLNLAGEYPPKPTKSMASCVKKVISVLSRHLKGSAERTIAGLYVPATENGYSQSIQDYVATRDNVTVAVLPE